MSGGVRKEQRTSEASGDRGALVVGGLAAILASTVAMLVMASPVWAGSKTIPLNVSNMTCVTCPLTVKLALTKVEGVSKAAVDFDKKEAVVTFDDAKTNAAALIKATTDAGYPSAVKQTEKK